MLSFQQLKKFPFADGTYKDTPKVDKPIRFHLEKDGRPVTIYPFHHVNEVPLGLHQVLHEELNQVIFDGLMFPFSEEVNYDGYVKIWFSHFVAVLVEGHEELSDNDSEWWRHQFLGTFFIRPNYPGRCSHVCNGGFFVNHKKRGLGLGKELGRKFILWAPQLGYVTSMFNLVFETNKASIKIWESLGFERVGYVRDAAVLKGIDHLVGAYIYSKNFNGAKVAE